ncbi:MAG: DUF421 domain-containing protein [Fibrobacteres bacterium]|nr:DUF421 domain-containing protein [Fibrobacterota bacterium]
MHPLQSWLNGLFGLDGGPNLWQMALRTLVIYLMSILLIRIGGDKRMLGRHAPFDIILSVIFGSVMSRAINGSAPFFQTIGVGFVFILIHRILALLAFRYRGMEVLLKGKPVVLIREGAIDSGAMRATAISDADLQEALFMKGKAMKPEEVALARLECNGEISVFPRRA